MYYVVGTAVVNAEESEPKQGRFIIFMWKDGKLLLLKLNSVLIN